MQNTQLAYKRELNQEDAFQNFPGGPVVNNPHSSGGEAGA